MKNGEFVREYYSDRALAMLFVRENVDFFGRKIYYGDFEGSTINYLEAIEREEKWFQEEYKEAHEDERF